MVKDPADNNRNPADNNRNPADGKEIRFLCAPLEGITGFPFRQIHHSMFPGIAAYYTPFLVANQTMNSQNG